jgi:hypothetical protein
MSIRSSTILGSRRLPRKAFLAAVVCAATLTGCLGAGDDSSVPLPDAGAKAADASHDGKAPTDGAAVAPDGASGPDATLQDASNAAAATPPAASFSTSTIDFGPISCGMMATAMPLTVSNGGGSPLHVSATEVGAGFTISPNALTVAPSATGTINVIAAVPATATAGTPMTGSIAMFTDDPLNSNVIALLSATPSGATLISFTPTVGFASTEVGVPSPPLPVAITNSGNAAATFTVGAPSDPSVTLTGFNSGGVLSLAPGTTLSGTATFVPKSSAEVNATAKIAITGGTCGQNLTSLGFTGQGASGTLAGWPSNNTIDFGSVSCGGAAPASQTITLTNSSLTTGVHITAVDASGIGSFTTDAMPGETIPAGGSLAIHFTAPAGPASAPTLTAVTGTLAITTDASPTATSLKLTEEPQGAVLAFGTAMTSGCTTSANLGSFGSAGILLQPGPSQNFCVVNTGNAPASVSLVAVEQGSDADAGAGDAAASDASVAPGPDSGIASPYSLTVPSFSLPAPAAASTPTIQQEAITFQPLQSGSTVGELTLFTSSVLCAPLPDGVPLSGSAIGGGPEVTPSALSFPATCGGTAPESETFAVKNASPNVDMSWALAGPVGSGAGQYTVTADPPPGTLAPGASSTITVMALAIPSPAHNVDPASLAAQVTITTDVPFDPPHVVTLGEIPLGDQIFVSVPDDVGNLLRFGQVPLMTSLTRALTLTNNANAGSPSASLALALGGTGATAYSLTSPVAVPGAGASVGVPVTFDPTTAGPFPATLTFSTSDALCSPLPAVIALQATGTAGAASLSASTLYFGANPTATDPTQRGLVACGSTGTTQTLTISNSGTQAFNLLGVTLGQGATSPFTLPGIAATPTPVPIGGSTAVTIAPSAIPAAVANPGGVTTFNDVLTVTTDIPNDTAHTVNLVMQPFGAVITGTAPPTAWSFGTVAEGSIGTFQGTMIQNTGNAPATVTFGPATPLSLPSVFGLQGNPVTVPPSGLVALEGQFTPNLPNGSWSGQADLVVTAGALCAPIPTPWMSPQIALSGTSTSNPLVTVTGSLVFPTTDCGGSPAPGQSVTLANQTNVPYAYTLKFQSGAHYTFADGGSGGLAANGAVTIVVNPIPVTPGPGVLAGYAPYADDLLISLASSPAMTFTVPVSWTLNGAVLSLMQGAGPFGTPSSPFYVADSTSDFPFQISNSGTADVTVDVAVQPMGAFSFLPTPPPVDVRAGIPPLLELVAAASSPACPTTNAGTASFAYVGPVCQPLPSSVSVDSCSGTYSGQMMSPPPMDAGAAGGDAAGGVEAGTDASASITACTQSPCGASGPNSVLCDGNTGSNEPAGVCSPTEAVFVDRDIAAGNLTATNQLKPYVPSTKTGSCYECLVFDDCIDDDIYGDTGKECGDVTAATLDGEPGRQECLDTLACIFTSKCDTADPPSSCFCGTASGAACLGAGAANGPCLALEIDGLGIGTCSTTYPSPKSCTEGDPTATSKAYSDQTRPAGNANAFMGCAYSNCKELCTP